MLVMVMQSGIILNVAYMFFMQWHYAECHYAECRYAESRGAEKKTLFPI
jgi:hypothetical protein